MNILHIGPELLRSTGGTTKAVCDFQRGIPGSSVLAVCDAEKLEREGPYDRSWQYIATSASAVGRRYLKPPSAEANRVVEMARGVDAVFSHMLYRYNTNLSKRIAQVHRVPYFVVPHGSLDTWVFSCRAWQKKAWLKVFGRKFLIAAQTVVFATQRELQKAQGVMDLANGVVIHWPIDVPLKLNQDKRSVRLKYGLPLEKRLLVCYGRLHSIKRPLELIAIFNNLTRSDVGLVLFGPDDDVTLLQCRMMAADREVPVVFCFPAQYGTELHELVLACDGYLSWSRKENFNYCLAESLARGLPVIVSEGNDLGPELRSIRCGWVLTDDSEETLVAAIAQFASVPDDHLSEMGARATKFAEESLSRDVFSRKLMELLTGKRR
jgi:glycosyltransferase involved in cell wall biosynthesis